MMADNQGEFVPVPDVYLSEFEQALKTRRLEMIAELKQSRAALPFSQENMKRLFDGSLCPSLDTFLFLADSYGYDVVLLPANERRFAAIKTSKRRNHAGPESDDAGERQAAERAARPKADCHSCRHFRPDNIRANCAVYDVLMAVNDMPVYCNRFEKRA